MHTTNQEAVTLEQLKEEILLAVRVDKLEQDFKKSEQELKAATQMICALVSQCGGEVKISSLHLIKGYKALSMTPNIDQSITLKVEDAM